jgi:regulator of sigma E protease
MGLLENIVAVVFVLGVMIFVHELGHFLAARYFDVRVEAFAFGFGPRLFGFKRGETDYKVCLLPLGGYVKMSGAEHLGEATGDERDLPSKPRWQRLIIAAMGPVFNVILAILLPAGLFMVQYERLAFFLEPATLGYVDEGSPADLAGIREGDTVVEINRRATPTWEAVKLAEIAAANSTIDVTVERGGERLHLPVKLGADPETGIGDAGWSESAPVRLDGITPGMPADQAGLQDGDILVSVNGEPILSSRKVPVLIAASEGKPVALEVRREGQVHNLEVTPIFTEYEGSDATWRIGVRRVGPDYERIETTMGFVEAFRESIDQNRKNGSLILNFLVGLFEQRMSPKQLAGPIGIGQLAGDAARSGWPDLIMLMSVISLNLAIFNMLPIPILDGGTITLLLMEMVWRKDLSITVKEHIWNAGLVFLMILIAFVMYNDIVKSLPAS